MNKRDIILLAVVIVISAVLFVPTLFHKSGTEAFVYVNKELYGRYDLAEHKELIIDSNGITDDIVIGDGYVYMKDATCPGRQCVHSGRISGNNESICCAPAGVMIVVKSEKDSEYDAITR